MYDSDDNSSSENSDHSARPKTRRAWENGTHATENNVVNSEDCKFIANFNHLYQRYKFADINILPKLSEENTSAISSSSKTSECDKEVPNKRVSVRSRRLNNRNEHRPSPPTSKGKKKKNEVNDKNESNSLTIELQESTQSCDAEFILAATMSGHEKDYNDPPDKNLLWYVHSPNNSSSDDEQICISPSRQRRRSKLRSRDWKSKNPRELVGNVSFMFDEEIEIINLFDENHVQSDRTQISGASTSQIHCVEKEKPTPIKANSSKSCYCNFDLMMSNIERKRQLKRYQTRATVLQDMEQFIEAGDKACWISEIETNEGSSEQTTARTIDFFKTSGDSSSTKTEATISSKSPDSELEETNDSIAKRTHPVNRKRKLVSENTSPVLIYQPDLSIFRARKEHLSNKNWFQTDKKFEPVSVQTSAYKVTPVRGFRTERRGFKKWFSNVWHRIRRFFCITYDDER